MLILPISGGEYKLQRPVMYFSPSPYYFISHIRVVPVELGSQTLSISVLLSHWKIFSGWGRGRPTLC